MDSLWTAYTNQFPEERAISLPSALQVVAILAYGATGQTLEEFKRVLGVTDQEQFLQILASTKQALTGPDLKTVNMFVFDQVKSLLSTPFYEKVAPYAVMAGLNIRDPQTLVMINNWIAQNTGFLNLLTPSDISGDVIIANALWFSDAWTSPFSKEDTKDEWFTRLNGQESIVPMMHKEFTLEHSGDKAVRLPLRNGAIAEFVMGLDPKQRISSLEYKSEKVRLYLPRFSIEQTIDLFALLKAAGLQAIAQPDYQRMLQSGNPLYIERMKQKIYVRFDEEGAEVKALTYTNMVQLSAIAFVPPVPVIRFNRPFHFRILKANQAIVEGFFNVGLLTPPPIEATPTLGFPTLPMLTAPISSGLPTLPTLTAPTPSGLPTLPILSVPIQGLPIPSPGLPSLPTIGLPAL